jgi:hypothetical protein
VKANPAFFAWDMHSNDHRLWRALGLNSHPGKVNRNTLGVLLVEFLSYFRVDVVKGNSAIFLALFMAIVRTL